MQNRIAALFFGLIFAGLFAFKMGWLQAGSAPETAAPPPSTDAFTPHSRWMNIYQQDTKIGYAHSAVDHDRDGLVFKESVVMSVNTMGLVHNIAIRSSGRLAADFSLQSFEFELNSGRFDFTARGTIRDDQLVVTTGDADTGQSFILDLREKIYFTSGALLRAALSPLNTGDRLTLNIFDPITMGSEPVVLTVVGKETIPVMDRPQPATRVSLSYRGAVQEAWIGADGDILKETGFMGIRLEKTTRADAVTAPVEAPTRDLTRFVSIPVADDLSDAATLRRLVIAVAGIENPAHLFDGGRQHFRDGRLIIVKEDPPDKQAAAASPMRPSDKAEFLAATPFIQSEHPLIRRLAGDITAHAENPMAQVEHILEWMHRHIHRRPVVSLPDALSTLKNRMGDCNEHAVLFAALCRASGIPCRIDAGVVYLNGRFYYHAWNQVFVGRWITVDALMQQFPADVTHIRLAGGDGQDTLNILATIGRLQLTIVDRR